jgi:hypothetical protein
LLRYYGAFAPNSPWRRKVVPLSAGAPDGAEPAGDLLAASAHDPHPGSAPPSRSDGQKHMAERRIDWATLLRRVYGVDALACPCGGRLRFVALVTEASTARAILESMGLPAEAPSFARSRDPTFESSTGLSFEM